MDELPKMNDLLEFLTGRYYMLEMENMIEKEKSVSNLHNEQNEKKQDKSIALASTYSNECKYCKGVYRIQGVPF
jgi:hypothetical protein